MGVPHREGDERLQPLGTAGVLLWSRVVPGPGSDQEAGAGPTRDPEAEPVDIQSHEGGFHRLHRLQRQPQPLLRRQVSWQKRMNRY